MNREDLYLEFARVINLCKGTALKPENCWKYLGKKQLTMPAFDGRSIEEYEFMVGIVEDRPVFPGDLLYGRCAGNPVLIDDNYRNFSGFKTLTWTKPKLAFSASMTDLPIPCSLTKLGIPTFLEIGTGYGEYVLNGTRFYFNTAKDRNLVADAIINILDNASKGRL